MLATVSTYIPPPRLLPIKRNNFEIRCNKSGRVPTHPDSLPSEPVHPAIFSFPQNSIRGRASANYRTVSL